MIQIAVVSGKGGTGKTTISALWASLAERAVFVDADVDASNLVIAIGGDETEHHEFAGRTVASVDADACYGCGTCAEVCRFGAIAMDGDVPEIDVHACEGCGLCSIACPHDAINMESRVTGSWSVSTTTFGEAVHARLNVGEGNSGALVTEVRCAAETRVAISGADTVLIDGPPGVGCRTTAALTGVDLAVIVTEPTVAALHDLERILGLTRRLGVRSAVLLNKIGLVKTPTEELFRLLDTYGAELLGALPFLRTVPALLSRGEFVTSPPRELLRELKPMWLHALSMARGEPGQLPRPPIGA